MQIFRYSDGVLPNSLLLAYCVLALLLSAAGVMHGNILGILMAIILMAHAMILMAYCTHECMHGTLFKSSKANDFLGLSLCWALGAGYLPYTLLKQKHLRHHTERADIVQLDYRQQLAQRPRLLHWVQTLSAYHIPVIEMLTHGLAIASPFLLENRKPYRSRVITVAISRLLFFVVLFYISPVALVSYYSAYIIALGVLGFFDAYQHDYDIKLTLDQPRSRPEHDRDFEESHTYSNLISSSKPWLNLAVLNFTYHNVHHWKSGEPWYRLPNLHQSRYLENCKQIIPMKSQLVNFHRHRLDRLLGNNNVAANISGAAGVSFLVGI